MMAMMAQRLGLQLSWPVLASTYAAGGVMAGCFLAYYLRNIAVKPRVIGAERIQSFLTRHVPIAGERFWPTWWAFHSMISTLGRVVIQKTRDTDYRREILRLQDGGQVGLDWNEPEEGKSTDKTTGCLPTVIILPGITGDSGEAYVCNAAAIVASKGYRAVVFNNRGMGGVPVTTPRAFCAANCEDLCEVVLHVQRQSPSSPIFIIGFSMGGMISTHFFGQFCRERAHSRPTRLPSDLPTCIAECNIVGGMGISTCFDPQKARQSLESTAFNRALNRHICGNLKRLVRRSSEVKAYKELIDNIGGLEHIDETEFISDFDARCTAPAFRFQSLDEYYTAAMPVRHLAVIDFPVLYINAHDDMFMPGDALPLEEIAASKSVAMVVTPWGGHLGFVEGAFPRGDSYAERMFAQFLDAVFTHGQEMR